MKAETAAAIQPTGPSSDKHQPTPISADIALGGPSNLPDPLTNAYRKDLADVALASSVIASHYAEPVQRRLAASAILRNGPYDDAERVTDLVAGDPFLMLDDSLGWAWGYAGDKRLVGYVPSALLTA